MVHPSERGQKLQLMGSAIKLVQLSSLPLGFIFNNLTHGHLFICPVLADLFSRPSYSVRQGLKGVGLNEVVCSNRLNAKLIEFRNRCHGSLGGAEKDAATDTDENPTQPFENRLPFEVTVKLLRCVNLGSECYLRK